MTIHLDYLILHLHPHPDSRPLLAHFALLPDSHPRCYCPRGSASYPMQARWFAGLARIAAGRLARSGLGTAAVPLGIPGAAASCCIELVAPGAGLEYYTIDSGLAG